MKKSEFISVIIRLAGVMFLAYAALLVIQLISGLVLLSSGPDAPSLVPTLVVDSIIRIVIALAVGLYLIIDGGLLFSILNRED